MIYLSLALAAIALIVVLAGWGSEIDHQRKDR